MLLYVAHFALPCLLACRLAPPHFCRMKIRATMSSLRCPSDHDHAAVLMKVVEKFEEKLHRDRRLRATL